MYVVGPGNSGTRWGPPMLKATGDSQTVTIDLDEFHCLCCAAISLPHLTLCTHLLAVVNGALCALAS